MSRQKSRSSLADAKSTLEAVAKVAGGAELVLSAVLMNGTELDAVNGNVLCGWRGTGPQMYFRNLDPKQVKYYNV